MGYSMLSVKAPQEKKPPRAERPVLTQVMRLERQDFQTTVRSQGTVRAETEAVLRAEVSGKVVEILPGLQDGAFFDEGDVLVRLDKPDFEAAVISAKASLARAESAYAQEQTKARQARLNWEDLGYEEEPNELVLRLPQLREAEANVSAAKANLASAERDLERTEVTAPFDGRILLRSVALGQTVNPGTTLATIFSTDMVEVRLPIAPRDLEFIQVPESVADPSVPVRLRDALRPESMSMWQGEIVGTEGALNEDSRELYVIARIPDPFSLKATEGQRKEALRIGQPVVVEMDGKVLEGVFAIPRDAVRGLDHITLVDPQELTLFGKDIFPIWSNETHLIVRDEEIEDGVLLSTSNLIYAPEGGKVEILPSTEEGNQSSSSAERESGKPDTKKRG